MTFMSTNDTGTILNFRGCAPLQYKRNNNEVMVYRVFRSTSTWESFDQALEKNRKNGLVSTSEKLVGQGSV